MVCKNCGKLISDQDAFCIHCGAKVVPLQETMNYGTNNGTAQQTTISNSEKSFPKLADGERMIKEYLCSTLKFPRCKGRIAVTNRRVIFHGRGDASNRIVQEVDVQEVKGVTSYYGTNFDWKKIIIGIIFILISLSALSAASSEYNYSGSGSGGLVGMLMLTIGICLIVFGIKKIFILEIYASSCSPAISIGQSPVGTVGNAATFSVYGEPTDETNQMMIEIGALIMDLQTLGEYAYEKWGVQ